MCAAVTAAGTLNTDRKTCLALLYRLRDICVPQDSSDQEARDYHQAGRGESMPEAGTEQKHGGGRQGDYERHQVKKVGFCSCLGHGYLTLKRFKDLAFNFVCLLA